MSWFASLSLRARLLTAFGAVIALCAGLGLFAMSRLAVVDAQITVLTDDWLPSVALSEAMNTTASKIRTGHFRQVAARSASERSAAERITAEETQSLATLRRQYGALVTNAEERALDGKGQKLGFASRISVNSAVVADNSLLVKYNADTPLGDTERADYIANQLDSLRFVSADRSGPRTGNFTLSGNVGDLISQTVNYQGDTIATALANNDTQSQSLDVLGQRMDSEYGVNVDEEMSRLMELQNAYSANARVVSVVQELLQALTNAI